MMAGFLARSGEFATRLLSGGTLEIVLLIVLIVVALILFLVALWILWKLLILLGKGLLWVFRAGGDATQKQRMARREARLTAPPPVATGWGSSPRIRLRKALAEARRRASPDAVRIVVVAGEGMSDLCRSLGLTPPGAGTVGLAAGGDTILIDASRADGRMLRRLAAALPWRRPADAIAAIVDQEGIPGDTLARASGLARATGFRLALHFVLAGASRVSAWRIIDANNRDGAAICTQLAEDTARVWLTGGSREGLKELSLAQSRDLPAALDRAFAAAPSSTVDIASFSFGGAGLRAAAAQASARTRPATTPGVSMWAGAAVLVAGLSLTALTAVTGLDRTDALRATMETASREAATSWLATGIDAVPSGSRVRRMAGLGNRLAEFSDFSPLTPLAPLVPNYQAPGRLGASLLEAYVLRPLAAALDRRARELLEPSEDPVAWLEDARLVGEWLAAWEGLAGDPQEVDLRRLFSGAFGGDLDAWSEGTDLALLHTGVRLPPAARGGLRVDGLTELARQSFIATMQRWAETVYTNGPVARAARRAGDRSTSWREQHDALLELRTALQDPGQYWLTAAEDRPDYGFELRILGRALGLSVLGQASALEAKAGVSRIRIDAREAAGYFILPKIGPLMVRSSSGPRGGGGGPSLALTPQAQAWLAFLERVRSAGFEDLPQSPVMPIAGPVTLDPAAVTATRAKLRVFDRFASSLPADLPPDVAQGLLLEVVTELVIGVTASVELALRPAGNMELAGGGSQRLARVAPVLGDLEEIEGWLRLRQAEAEADRALEVRSRVAENMLEAGASVLAVEDPIGVYVDPAADANALVRRFERGVTRLQHIYEQFGAPFVKAAALGGKENAYEWKDIGEDLEGYRRGDANASLTGLEGMLRAYAEDPAAACAAPRATRAAARDDYVARALSRFRVQMEHACSERVLARTRKVIGTLGDYFERQVGWQWPYSKDPNAPEIPASTLSDFVTRLHAAAEELSKVEGAYLEPLLTNTRFWSLDDDGGVAVVFRIDWRTRPTEEMLAEHVIAFEVEGAERDEGGVYTWRYGVPAALKLRLARNSPYRFAGAVDPAGVELVLSEPGNGGLLRLFDGRLSGGALTIAAEVVDEQGARLPLRVTARVTRPDGVSMTLPQFNEYHHALGARVVTLGG